MSQPYDEINVGRRPEVKQNRLQKLKREDLLKILYRQQRQIEELEAELARAKNELADRTLAIRDLGSIAEASLKINKVFEAAEKAARQYVENARVRAQGAANEPEE